LSSKSFDWKSLQKYLNPEAANDFSRFMDTIPVHAGKGVLIAGGIAWAAVACIGFFTILQTKEITELRATLESSEAIKPLVPVITVEPVSNGEVVKIVNTFKTTYPSLTYTANANSISIKSKQTSDFAQFREAIGHVVNGGKGWKVEIETLCIGRECKDSGLGAKLKIQKLKIDKPSS
jgi:hypothetical protein